MKHIILSGIFLALVGLTTQARSSSVVDPKVILELQPQSHELGDMFYDPTVQQMLNRGYTHVANFKADVIGGLTMEVLGAELEASGYGWMASPSAQAESLPLWRTRGDENNEERQSVIRWYEEKGAVR